MNFHQGSTRQTLRPAFTLVEMLVVIAIIGILLALLLPAVQAAREAGRRVQCSNNLKQTGLAIHNFHDTTGRLPPSHTGGLPGNDKYGTWLVVILPYLEQANLYGQFDLTTTWDAGSNPAAAQLPGAQLSVYQCPSRHAGGSISDNSPQVGATGDYAAGSVVNPSYGNYQWQWQDPSILWGALIGAQRNGPVWKSRLGLSAITDGLSNTIVVGEKHIFHAHLNRGGFQNASGDGNIYVTLTAEWWETHSVRNTDHPNGLSRGPQDHRPDQFHTFGSWHPGVCQFVLCDASVQSISATIDLTTLNRLGDRRDGNPVQLP